MTFGAFDKGRPSRDESAHFIMGEEAEEGDCGAGAASGASSRKVRTTRVSFMVSKR